MNVAIHIGKRDKGRRKSSRSSNGFWPDLLQQYNSKYSMGPIHVRTILAFLPVSMAIAGCSVSLTPEETVCEMSLTKAPASGISSLDLFYYNDDTESRLDSYQRFTDVGTQVLGASRNGKKSVVAITNLREDRYSWSDISSLPSLEKVVAHLDEDSPSEPVMSASAHIDAGRQSSCSMVFRPVMSEVILRSIRCDFSSRSYHDAQLEDIEVYLTNVCTAWPVLKDTLAHSSDYVNVGRADSTTMSKMAHPEYIYSHPGTKVGSATVRPDLHFFCYPNVEKEESLGSPFTRLVIEGTLEGKRYYYPVNVNRRSDAKGVERNCVYILDMVLTRRGTTDPDTAVDTETAQITLSVVDWNDKGKQYVSY